jgi:hypothetical protein
LRGPEGCRGVQRGAEGLKNRFTMEKKIKTKTGFFFYFLLYRQFRPRGTAAEAAPVF